MRSVSFTAGNNITLLHSGAEFFPALISAIDQARLEIYLETYIFAADETADRVKAALIRAAARGVTVNVITDWVGTGHRQTRLLMRQFGETGVNYRVFNAWFHRGITCTHRKICVVDGHVAFLGGININDDLRADDNPADILPAPRWDFSVLITGPLVPRIHKEVEAQWGILGGLNLRYRWEKFRDVWSRKSTHADAPMLAALVVRDNLRNRRTIQKSYLKALGSARYSAWLATPYFAPGRKLRNGLAAAARRGVNVTLLIGVGQFRIQDAVAHSIYPKLLKAGVKLVEYRKTQLHAKIGAIDDEWATVGSSNWDGLSLLINQEANVVILDKDFSRQLRAHIERGVADGVAIARDAYHDVPWFKRLWYGAAAMFYRSVLRVIAFGKYEE